MRIYPAIDLLNGHCVRLQNGVFSNSTTYSLDPLLVAREFEEQGMQYLHVIDLDGAKIGSLQQFPIIKKITTHTGLHLQVGGGIRHLHEIEELLQLGVDRVILGSVAVTNSEFVKECLERFGAEKIVLAVDVNSMENYQVAISGWQTSSLLSLWQLLDYYRDCDIKNILCTDIAKDGSLTGPNFWMYQNCRTLFPQLNFIASGGVSSLQDIKKLQTFGLHSCIIGKAIYEKKVSLACLQNELSPV